MTNEEWLAKVKDSENNLVYLINAYHPASNGERIVLPITAPAPEAACENIRQDIREKADGINPVEKSHAALGSADVDTISNILSETWFGVPESTECWSIRGFAEVVELMDDPPDKMYDDE